MSDADRIIFNSTEFAVFDEALEFLLAILARTIAEIDSNRLIQNPKPLAVFLKPLSPTPHTSCLSKRTQRYGLSS